MVRDNRNRVVKKQLYRNSLNLSLEERNEDCQSHNRRKRRRTYNYSNVDSYSNTNSARNRSSRTTLSCQRRLRFGVDRPRDIINTTNYVDEESENESDVAESEDEETETAEVQTMVDDNECIDDDRAVCIDASADVDVS